MVFLYVIDRMPSKFYAHLKQSVFKATKETLKFIFDPLPFVWKLPEILSSSVIKCLNIYLKCILHFVSIILYDSSTLVLKPQPCV